MTPGITPALFAAVRLVLLRLVLFCCLFLLPVGIALTQGINCNNPLSLSCGVAIVNTTNGGQNDFVATDYPCVSNSNTYMGEDRIFRLNLPKDDWYDIILDNLGASLDLFLLFNACSDQGIKDCFAASTKTGTTSEKIGPVYLRASDHIYALVDGINSTSKGSFRIRLTCYNKPSTAACPPGYSSFNPLNIHDNFEIYTTGSISTKSTIWKKFATGAADGSVSTARAYHGTKSLLIRRTTTAPDVLFPLGNIDRGRFRLQWKMFVVSNAAAYYNLQHKFSGGNWAYEVFFNTNGTGSVKYLNSNKLSFKYKQNQWISVTQIIDMDRDLAELFIDGKYVGNWTWSVGTVNSNPVSSNKLGAINFYANTGCYYYVDDICLYRTGCFDCAVTSEDVEVCIYPGNTYVNESCAICAGYTAEEWGANNCAPNYDKVTFEFGLVSGQPMSELSVPVKVYNFSNITAASFTLALDFADAVQITGMSTINLFGDIGFYESIPGQMFTFTWFNNDGLTYPDGTTLFEIGVKLLGEEGMSANLHVINNPVNIAVYQNGKPVDYFMRIGTVFIGMPDKSIEGEIKTFNNNRVDFTYLLAVNNVNPPEPPFYYFALGGDLGMYRINGLRSSDNLRLSCTRIMDDLKEGLDVGDLIVLWNHIYGRTIFIRPEQYIAADVNRSNSITYDDFVQLKSVILGEKQSFESTDLNPVFPWVFIPNTEILTYDKAINHTYLTDYFIAPFTKSLTGIDFWGIKLGELNLEYNTSVVLDATLSTRQTVDAAIPVLTAKPRSIVTLPILLNHTSDIQGLDLELHWDPGLADYISLSDFHELSLPDQWYIDESGTSSGLLRIKCLGLEQPLDLNGRIASLQFKVLGQPGEVVPVEISTAKIYNANGQLLSGTLHHGSVQITNEEPRTSDDFFLYPNPAQDYLNISGLSEGDNVEYLINPLGQKTPLHWTGKTSYVLNTSSLTSGMYYLVTRQSGRIIVKPVIIR